MARKKPKGNKRRLCVYLFKDGCSSWEDVFKDSSALVKCPIKGFAEDVMTLFIKGSVSFLPKWLGFFDGFLDKDIESLFNSSSSAALLVKHDERIFAFTFGYGRSFLNLNLIEDNFGLKVALNNINADKIRSVDIKNLDTVVRHSKVQTSQAGTVDDFGLNIDRDILNAVTGLSNDEVLGKQVSGAVSLHISIPVKVDDLPELCTKLLKKFNDKTYKERFPWVDHITDVKNTALIEELNSLLIKAIHDKDFERLFLAIPEIINWELVQGFKYKPSDQQVREDIHMADVLPPDEELREKVNLAWLKRKKVLCVSSDTEEVIYSWSFYKCINYEIKKSDKDAFTYLLSAGKWFKIDTDYVNSVSKETKDIPEYSNFQFLEHEGENEGEYNERVYESDKERCVLMDKKNIVYGGGRSRIEFCDLFIDKKDFVHVKRFRGSSALSHLFFQGLNSAFLLLTDFGFLKKVNKELPQAWKFGESSQIRASDYEVVFAVISKVKKGTKDIFPFFSKVSLLQVYKQLKAYGYKVSIAKIEVKEEQEQNNNAKNNR